MTLSVGPNIGLLDCGAPGEGHYAELMRQWRWMDFLLQPVVKSRTAALPTSGQVDGDAYILTAAGANQNKIVRWTARLVVPAWEYLTPKVGWRVQVANELDGSSLATTYGYTGAEWAEQSTSGGGVSVAPVIVESTTARTLSASDARCYLRFTNAGVSTATVAPQASETWAPNTEIHIRRAAAGNLTLTPGSGVTLNAPGGGTLVMTSGMSVTLKRAGADVWDVIGQTVAA